MKRTELKLNARTQITGYIQILILCHFGVYVISHLSSIAEMLARTFYYPRTSSFWFQNGVHPGVKYMLSGYRELVKYGCASWPNNRYFMREINRFLAEPYYPAGIITLISLLSIISFLIFPAFKLGLSRIYLNLSKDEAPSLDKFLSGVNSFGKSLWLQIIIGFFTFLWTLLLIVPGIIKYISYSMSYYILAENPEITALEALNKSKRLMDGHKMDYFILMLSFFWWYLLAALTFGIAYIYVSPYVSAAQANFYLDIKPKEDDSVYTAPEISEELEENYENGIEE